MNAQPQLLNHLSGHIIQGSHVLIIQYWHARNHQCYPSSNNLADVPPEEGSDHRTRFANDVGCCWQWCRETFTPLHEGSVKVLRAMNNLGDIYEPRQPSPWTR